MRHARSGWCTVEERLVGGLRVGWVDGGLDTAEGWRVGWSGADGGCIESGQGGLCGGCKGLRGRGLGIGVFFGAGVIC